jgi:hypothetical protein
MRRACRQCRAVPRVENVVSREFEKLDQPGYRVLVQVRERNKDFGWLVHAANRSAPAIALPRFVDGKSNKMVRGRVSRAKQGTP